MFIELYVTKYTNAEHINILYTVSKHSHTLGTIAQQDIAVQNEALLWLLWSFYALNNFMISNERNAWSHCLKLFMIESLSLFLITLGKEKNEWINSTCLLQTCYSHYKPLFSFFYMIYEWIMTSILVEIVWLREDKEYRAEIIWTYFVEDCLYTAIIWWIKLLNVTNVFLCLGILQSQKGYVYCACKVGVSVPVLQCGTKR